MTKELQQNLYRQGADNKVLFCEVMAGLLNRREEGTEGNADWRTLR